MTPEQETSKALTGQIEVTVGDAFKIMYAESPALVRVTKITKQKIYFRYSRVMRRRIFGKWGLPHENNVSHAEFVRGLRRYQEDCEIPVVVLDMRPEEEFDSKQSLLQVKNWLNQAAAAKQGLMNKVGGKV